MTPVCNVQYQRPSAAQLLEHPFLELGNELDDEPVDSDIELSATDAAAAVTAATTTVSATGTAATPSSSLPRQVSPPPPLFAPLSSLHLSNPRNVGSGAGAGARTSSGAAIAAATATAAATVITSASSDSNGSAYASGETPGIAINNSKTSQHDASCPGCRGAGGWSSCTWSPVYTPSCVSTASPSPSSPCTAPSFGGVPTTPSPPPVRGIGTSNIDWVGRGETVSPRLGTRDSGGAGDNSGLERFLPAGITAATLANATALAAQINAANRFAAASGSRGNKEDRVRAVSCSERESSSGSAQIEMPSGVPGGGSGGGTVAPTSRARSASEDAVWDLLPSDERECRRPFTCSAVERWHG